MKTFDIQQALRRQGFDPGPVDGAMGPLTRAAIARFEKDHGLSADGAPDDAFLKALLGETQATAWLPWYAEAERRKGLHEIRDKVELAAFLRSDGATLGDPTKLPWCGDFVETCVAVGLPGEPLPENPYLARNWLKFGVVCAPTEGAVLARREVRHLGARRLLCRRGRFRIGGRLPCARRQPVECRDDRPDRQVAPPRRALAKNGGAPEGRPHRTGRRRRSLHQRSLKKKKRRRT
jgi:hypothetical protein